MKTFQERFKEPRPIILDGATGTELNRRGVDTRLPLWSSWALIGAQETLYQIHLDYLKAGAEVLTTNTFRTHRRTLFQAGLDDQTEELTQLAVKIAGDAVRFHIQAGGHPAWVAGSVAPLEDCYRPDLVPPQAECIKEHAELVHNLAESGVDLFLIETMNTIREAEAASKAAQQTGIPFIVSFVLRTDGRLFSGESIAEAARRLEVFEPIMLGINCTPTSMISSALVELKQNTRRPISGYGNIGHTDDIDGWEITEDITPEAYGDLGIEWQQIGVKMLGGCCGTSPDHIAALARKIQGGDKSPGV